MRLKGSQEMLNCCLSINAAICGSIHEQEPPPLHLARCLRDTVLVSTDQLRRSVFLCKKWQKF
jgi:hypothetical protein